MQFVFYTFKRKKGNDMADIWMVTEGATLECTLGTMTSKLQVRSEEHTSELQSR